MKIEIDVTQDDLAYIAWNRGNRTAYPLGYDSRDLFHKIDLAYKVAAAKPALAPGLPEYRDIQNYLKNELKINREHVEALVRRDMEKSVRAWLDAHLEDGWFRRIVQTQARNAIIEKVKADLEIDVRVDAVVTDTSAKK